MEHNNKIRQEFRDKTETMVMGYTHDGIPFSSEYVLWLEDELNKLRIADVSQQREQLAKYTRWQGGYYEKESDMYADIDKFLNG